MRTDEEKPPLRFEREFPQEAKFLQEIYEQGGCVPVSIRRDKSGIGYKASGGDYIGYVKPQPRLDKNLRKCWTCGYPLEHGSGKNECDICEGRYPE